MTERADPPKRNVFVVHYDNEFLFMARNYGDHRDSGGNTKPGFFVHSKAHGRWLQILRVSTKDAKFGKSATDNPEDARRLMLASVGWDFTAYTNRPFIELPLTGGSIAFPENVELDSAGERYKLSFFTSFQVESATTVLYVNRKNLREQFDKGSNQ